MILSLLLIGLFCLTSLNSVLRRLQRKDLKKKFANIGNLFFYRKINLFFFPSSELENLFFVSTLAQNILRFLYATVSILILVQTGLLSFGTPSSLPGTSSILLDWPTGTLTFLGLFLLFFLVGDYIPRILGIKYPQAALRLAVIPASFFMLILFPITYLFLKLSKFFTHSLYFDHLTEPHAEAKQEIIEMIQDLNMTTDQLELHEKKLFASLMGFRDRIAREVMVPRVDVFSLSAETPIEECAHLILSEGYSRIPVYKNSLDNIVGVLMYKDVLAKYVEYVNKGNDINVLKAPISTLAKSIIYTPETKKISQLLQEFRKKQVHLAIIVDEYGGTEGIVTIEDILEEIVGDIADEYDEEEALFLPLPTGGWLLDARMTILDIEEQLGIEIPQEGDYDTIGGYVFHETGMIPQKGYIINKPTFELEVLRSNDRRVEKVRIQSIKQEDDNHENNDNQNQEES